VTGPQAHLEQLAEGLRDLRGQLGRIAAWGGHIAETLLGGGRLLACGNGGSAAEAQHLTAELVGRYRTERIPLSAICLHGDTSSLTAIANDYGHDEAFARQVRAHGRPGDVLLALSTSGRSPNVVEAARAAGAAGMRTLALTGPGPNPLSEACHDALTLDRPTPTVQEAHLVVVHLICQVVDDAVAALATPARETAAWGPDETGARRESAPPARRAR
jgi:D-sedoheptulose 7-phosphate isomerase